MRVLVAAPPKTGNVWLEKLLSSAFGLQWVREAPPLDYWVSSNAGGLREFLALDRFPEAAICHQHFWPSRELFDLAGEWNIALATTLRDPYDQFVSWYWYIQRFSSAFLAANDPGAVAIGKAIDDPEVLTLLATRFGRFLDQGGAWLESRRSLIVRYEDLQSRPAEVIGYAGEQWGLPQVLPADQAIALASADALRQLSPDLRLHVRAARIGDWREHLTEQHLEIFRTHHRERIERLGYLVQ